MDERKDYECIKIAYYKVFTRQVAKMYAAKVQ